MIPKLTQTQRIEAKTQLMWVEYLIFVKSLVAEF